MLDLTMPNRRGRPLTPVQQVCIALNFFGGGHFNRVSALCGGVSSTAAWNAIGRVTNQLVACKRQFMRMPTPQEMAATAQRLRNRFHLPRFALEADCVIVKFDGALRKLPPGVVKQNHWCWKMVYGINTQVVGNDAGKILDINITFHGATHDARIWSNSSVKRAIESQGQFLVAGDSGYPISKHLITPYRTAEALVDPSKALFNRRHSGLRTVMTENIFGVWKRRFPCINFLRCH